MADTGSPGMVLFAYISFALGGVLVVGGCIYMIIWAFCNKCLPCGRKSGNKGDSKQVGHAKYMDKNLSGRGNAKAQEGDTESLNYEGHTFLPRDSTTEGAKQTQAQVEAYRRSNGAAVSVHEESEVGMVKRESSKKKDDKKRRGMVIGAAAAATTTAVVAGATTIIISEHEDGVDEGRHGVVGEETMRTDGSLHEDQHDSRTNLVHNEDTNTFMSAAVVDESMGDGHNTITDPTTSSHYTEDNIGRESSFHQEEIAVQEHIESVEAAPVVSTERVHAFSDDYLQDGSRTSVIGGQEQEDWRSQAMESHGQEVDEFSTQRFEGVDMDDRQSGYEAASAVGAWQQDRAEVTSNRDSVKIDNDNWDRDEFVNNERVEHDQTSLLQESFGVAEVAYQQDSIADLGRKGSIDELVRENSLGKPSVSDFTHSRQNDYEIEDAVKYNGEQLTEIPHSTNNGVPFVDREDTFHVQGSNDPVDLSNPDLQDEVRNNDERLLQQLQNIDKQDSIKPAGTGLTLLHTDNGEGSGAENTEFVNERPIYSDTDERESDEDRGMSVMAVGVTGASLAGNKILRKKKMRSPLFRKGRKGENEESLEMASLEPQSIDSPDENDDGEAEKRKSKKEKEKEQKIRKREIQKEEELRRKREKEEEKERRKLLEREKRESKKASKKQKANKDTHNIVATAIPLVAATRDTDEDTVIQRENLSEDRRAEEESQRFHEESVEGATAAIPVVHETSREEEEKTKKEKEKEEKEKRKEKEQHERESKKEKERLKKEKELQTKREKEEEKLKKKQQEQEEKERKKMSKKKQVVEEYEEQQQPDGAHDVRVSDVALVAASNIERTETHQAIEEKSQEIQSDVEGTNDNDKEGISKKEERKKKKELERQERESKRERERQQKEDELQRKREKEEEKLRKKQQEKEERASKKNKNKKDDVEVEEIEHEQDHEVRASAIPIVAAMKEEETSREDDNGDKKKKKEMEREEKEKKKELERQERESKKERERLQREEELQRKREKEEEKLRKKQQEKEERASKKNKNKKDDVEVEEIEHEQDHEVRASAIPIVAAMKEEETSREDDNGDKKKKKEMDKEERERKKELERQERESKKERERLQKEEELQRKREKEEEKLRKKQQEKEERASKKKNKNEKDDVEVEDEQDHEVRASAIPIVAAMNEQETSREEDNGDKKKKKEMEKEEKERKKELERQDRESKKERERLQKEEELQRKREKEEEKLRKKQQEKEERASKKKNKNEKDDVEVEDEQDHEVRASAIPIVAAMNEEETSREDDNGEKKKKKEMEKEEKERKKELERQERESKKERERLQKEEELQRKREKEEEKLRKKQQEKEERVSRKKNKNEKDEVEVEDEQDHEVRASAIPIVAAMNEQETSREEDNGDKKKKKEMEKEEKERKKELERQERESKKERERLQKEEELQRKREKEEEKLRKKQQEKEERASKKKNKNEKDEVEVEDEQDHEVRASAIPIVAAMNEEETSREDDNGEKKKKKDIEKEEKERKKELERQERESKKERERLQKEEELQRKREKEEEKLRKKQQEKEERASKKKNKNEKDEVEVEDEQDHEVRASAIPIVAAMNEQETSREEDNGDKKKKKEMEKEEKERKKELEHQERESKKERERLQKEEELHRKREKEEEKLRKRQKEQEERESRKIKKKQKEVMETDKEEPRIDEEERSAGYGGALITGVKDSKKDKKSKKKEKDSKKKKKDDDSSGKEEEQAEEIENEQNNFREDQQVQGESSDSKKEKKKSLFGFRKSKRTSGTEEDKSNVLYAAAPIAGTAAVGAVTAAVLSTDRNSEYEPDVRLSEGASASEWQQHNVMTTDTQEDDNFTSNLLEPEHATVVNKNLLPTEGDSDSLLIADSPGPRARSSPILYEEDEYQDSSFGATGGMAIKKELVMKDDEGYQTHDQDGDSSTRDIQFDRDSSGEQRPHLGNDNFDEVTHQTMEEQRKSGLDMDQTHHNQGYSYSNNDDMEENTNVEDTHYEKQSYTESPDLHRETEVSSYHDNVEMEREDVADLRASRSPDWEEAAGSQLSTGRTEQTSVGRTHSPTWDNQGSHSDTAGSVLAVGPSFTDELHAAARQNNDDDDDEDLPISKSILADIRQKRNLKSPIRSDSVESGENKDGTLFDELHTVLRSKKKEDRASAEIAYDVDDTRYTGNTKLANEHLTEEYDTSAVNVKARASLFEKITETTGEKVIPSYGGITATQSYIRPLSPTVMRLAEGASVKSSLSDNMTEHRDVTTDAESDQVEYHYKPNRDSLTTTDHINPSQDAQAEYQYKPARDSFASGDPQSYNADEHGEQYEQHDASLTNGHIQTFNRNEDSFDEPVDAIKPSMEEANEEGMSSYREGYGGAMDEAAVYHQQEASTADHLTNGDYMTNGHSDSLIDNGDGQHSFSEELPDSQDLDKSMSSIKVKELNRMAVHDNFNSDVDASMVF